MKAVVVEWHDACQGAHGWHSLDDASKETALKVRAVGWLIAEHDDRIVIAGAYYESGCSDVNVIPRACIDVMRQVEIWDVPVPNIRFPGMPHDVHAAFWRVLNYAEGLEAGQELLRSYWLMLQEKREPIT